MYAKQKKIPLHRTLIFKSQAQLVRLARWSLMKVAHILKKTFSICSQQYDWQ